MKDFKIDKDTLKKLRESLPHGAITELARDLGYSRQNVINVLNGDYYNEEIILEAIEKIQLQKGIQQGLEELIKSTVN